MSGEPVSERAARHVAAFNDGVRTGDWAAFARRFTPDAVMRFTGGPAGRSPAGRRAVHRPRGSAAGYAAQPPTATLTVVRGVSSGDVDELWFAWDSGGTPAMLLRWRGDLITELTVTFS